jgi:hypothetical protein
MFLIVGAVIGTLAIAAIVLLTVVRSIRKEQRGFDVKPPPPGDRPE